MSGPDLDSAESHAHGPVVVGIGASAGGLQALQELFATIPADSGLAWVVVVHLHPDQDSHIAGQLEKVAAIPVRQVNETTPLEPDHAYVIPPGSNLSAIDSHLRLDELERSPGDRATIDHFLRTLSRTHGKRAVAIILSGTGSDGTRGARELKREGGLVLAQDPEEAGFPGMPQQVEASGVVDRVLPADQMVEAILSYLATRPEVSAPKPGEPLPPEHEDRIARILSLVREHTGHDFHRYKRPTVIRRIRRRMQLCHRAELDDYFELLEEDEDELRALFNDLLINVTRFFRDSAVFELLEEQVIPKLFDGKQAGDVVRVWVAGCATGEEAYSLAILLCEHRDRIKGAPQVKIFASDLHRPSLEQARSGRYPDSVAEEVGPERMERFFTRAGDSWRVRQDLRDMVVFAPHNLLKDPPFSQLDLISCRNMLIYLQRRTQRRLIELFHYALDAEGYLLLGTSETVEDSALFRPLTKAESLYRRCDVHRPRPRLPIFPLSDTQPRSRTRGLGVGASGPGYGPIHQELLERHAPASLLVDDALEIIHVAGDAGRFLQQPAGEPTNHVINRIRDELRVELRSCIFAACNGAGSALGRPVILSIEGEARQVVLRVVSCRQNGSDVGYLVFFAEAEPPKEAAVPTGEGGVRSAEVDKLNGELEATRQRLQAIISDYEASQEDMRATNEELQSTNEELRSTMEELETSREELQSMNEELTTVNEENRRKVEELSQLSSDLQNLMGATDIATLFLDRQLRIFRFTDRVSELFNVRPSDQGRPLSDLTHKLGYDDVLDDARQVLRKLAPVEREVAGEGDRWYLMRTLPYRSLEDRIEGVVITFVDISELKRSERALREARDEARRQAADAQEGRDLLEAILDHVPEGIVIGEAPDATIRRISQHGAALHGRTVDELVGLSAGEFGEALSLVDPRTGRRPPDDRIPLTRAVRDGEVITEEEWLIQRDNGVLVPISCNAGPIRNGDDRITGGVVAWRDITPLKEALEDLQEREQELSRLAESLERRVEERTEQVRALASNLTLAEQRERRRIAGVLHDDLQQLLYGTEMQLELVRRGTDSVQMPALNDAVAAARDWLTRAIQLTRRLTVDLSPPVLRDEGIAEALSWLASQMEQMHGLEVTVSAEESLPRLPDDLRVLVFQAVRELLFNIVKHAGVDEARVELSSVDTDQGPALRVRVHDDGQGFDVEGLRGASAGGYGLFSVEERLELCGGRAHIESSPGGGTRVELIIPQPPP